MEHTEKTDLRVLKTLDALTDAFWTLVEKTDFEKITVKELCTLARIRTATFYTHFADKFEFFMFLVKRISTEYIREDMLEADNPTEYIRLLIKADLDFVDQNEKMLNLITTDGMLNTIAMTNIQGLSDDITRRLESFEREGFQLPAMPEVMTQMFVGAATRTGRWWMKNRDHISKEELLKQATAVFIKFVP